MSKTAAEEDCTGTNCVLRREKSRASNNIYNPSRRTHNTTGWDYTKGYRLVIGEGERSKRCTVWSMIPSYLVRGGRAGARSWPGSAAGARRAAARWSAAPPSPGRGRGRGCSARPRPPAGSPSPAAETRTPTYGCDSETWSNSLHCHH